MRLQYKTYHMQAVSFPSGSRRCIDLHKTLIQVARKSADSADWPKKVQ